jgi:seryl-tRNA synthetase
MLPRPLVLLAALLAAAPAPAQDPAELRDQLRRTTAELRATQDALAQMRAERDALQHRLQAPAAAAPAPAAAGETTALRAAVSGLQTQNAALQAALRQTQGACRQAAAQAQARESPAAPPEQQASTAGPEIQSCREKNARLISLGEEILHLYETQDFRSLLLGSYEPLLGLKRVELENLVQDYDDKLRDQDVRATPGAPHP